MAAERKYYETAAEGATKVVALPLARRLTRFAGAC